MNLSIKKGWLIAIGVILLFVLLNPTPTDFKNYKGGMAYQNYGNRRMSNFLLFSIYWDGRINYLAILKNFIPIPQESHQSYNPGYNYDSTKVTVYADSIPANYIDRVYKAIQANLTGFNKTPYQFRELVTTNKDYRNHVYEALKDNLQGFNTPKQEFDSLILKN